MLSLIVSVLRQLIGTSSGSLYSFQNRRAFCYLVGISYCGNLFRIGKLYIPATYLQERDIYDDVKIKDVSVR